jgi:hypothetical protein
MESTQVITILAASTGVYILYKIIMALKRTIIRIGVIAAVLTQTTFLTDFKNVDIKNIVSHSTTVARQTIPALIKNVINIVSRSTDIN